MAASLFLHAARSSSSGSSSVPTTDSGFVAVTPSIVVWIVVISPGGAELPEPTSTARMSISFTSAGLSVNGATLVYALPVDVQRN
jgi:hypothetical protein